MKHISALAQTKKKISSHKRCSNLWKWNPNNKRKSSIIEMKKKIGNNMKGSFLLWHGMNICYVAIIIMNEKYHMHWNDGSKLSELQFHSGKYWCDFYLVWMCAWHLFVIKISLKTRMCICALTQMPNKISLFFTATF